MLLSFLEMVNSALSCAGGPSNMFPHSAGLLKEFLAHVMNSESLKIQEKYAIFLKKVRSLISPPQLFYRFPSYFWHICF
jgi:hypothetical protein